MTESLQATNTQNNYVDHANRMLIFITIYDELCVNVADLHEQILAGRK